MFFFPKVNQSLKCDWEITRGNWSNKEKISRLSSPNNHWQHKTNKSGQQKCIPHAHAGLIGHLSWHSSNLALLLKHSLGFFFFFSTVQLELTSQCNSWRNLDTPTENSTGSPMIPVPGNEGSSAETRNLQRKEKKNSSDHVMQLVERHYIFTAQYQNCPLKVFKQLQET